MEQDSLVKDTKAYMKGRVCNKLARHNLCFAHFDQKAHYEEGKGTVINFNRLPHTGLLRDRIRLLTKTPNLVAEGNYYYDTHKCGINYHGDSERTIVLGVRLGEDMPLCFRWYKNHKHDGFTRVFNLHSGDIYIFSEKAVGSDWKRSSIWTLRHAAGSDKYIQKIS